MSSKDRLDEFKIGLFVLGAAALLIVALLRMDVVRKDPRQDLKAVFHFAGGLESGAAVRMAGVLVGEVERLKIVRREEGNTVVEVTAGVDPEVVVPVDSQIVISTNGLLGTKYLEILPGSGAPKTAQDVFVGQDPVQIDTVISTGERMARKMEHTIDLVNQMVEDQDFQTAVKTNGENLSSLITEMRSTAKSMNEILDGIKSGRGLIGKLLTDESVYDDVKSLVADIRQNPWKLWKKR